MMPEPGKLVLVDPRRSDEKVERMINDVHDIKFRVTNLEEGQAGIQRRLDRVEARLDRIERVSISSNCHIEVMT
jgi:hypothetical protein